MIIVAKITCYDIRPRSVPSDITGFIFNGVSMPSSRKRTNHRPRHCASGFDDSRLTLNASTPSMFRKFLPGHGNNIALC